uniref:NADH-ubiquinone oxidoreductase chain 5 n=1 Tax=Sphenodon punctatus TaxID=8508 RepID=A0A7U3RNA4_SPHPU|nr:NADH dehydrogenase subunit 5 [Sphenodon punctatus]
MIEAQWITPISTMMLASIGILLYPLVVDTLFKSPKTSMKMQARNAVKYAFFSTLATFMMFINLGMESSTTHIYLISSTSFNVGLSFKFDYYTLMFCPTALFVTWSIMDFAKWYMAHDPENNKFFKYLLVFLLAMLTLVSSNNLFQLFIGWEGVGIMSFLLIGWWRACGEANTTSMQAIIYNRLGDIGFVLALAWTGTSAASWELDQLFALKPFNTVPLLALVLAAAAKSAQFGMHPWLLGAMEGPTPVSALLHSSTMVVAGIFLLIHLHPMMEDNELTQTLCLLLGAISTFMTAMCTLTQNDIKKIIALSTASQLGLMMTTIGLNQPNLAFLHMCLHAFFKSKLFICSGIISHNLSNEQDIRKMGGIHKAMPITSSCFTIGNLALPGIPFMTGFYSKDAIIETMNSSTLNLGALLLTMTATVMTAAYTARLIFLVQTGRPRHYPMQKITEDKALSNAILRLSLGSMVPKPLSTLTLTQTQTLPTTVTTLIKLSVLGATMTGILMSLIFVYKNKQSPPQKNNLSTFSNMLTFYSSLAHWFPTTRLLKKAQKVSTALNDTTWYEYSGPKALSKAQLKMSKALSFLAQGKVKTYLAVFTMSLVALIVLMTLPT